MEKNTKDIRTHAEKKRDSERIKKELKSPISFSSGCFYDPEVMSKAEYVEAREFYYKRKAREDAINKDDYDNWLLLHFIEEFVKDDSEANSWRNYAPENFKKAAPVCFSIIEEQRQLRNQHDETEKAVKTAYEAKHHFNGKEKKAFQNARKERLLFYARGGAWVSNAELIDLVLESDSEAWENKYTPGYLHSMAVVYKLFEIRGVEPSPEEEEKLKYEILEKEVRYLCNHDKIYYRPEPGNKNNYRYENVSSFQYDVFPDIASIYLGLSNRIEPYEHWNDECRKEFFYITQKDANGVVKRYTRASADIVWDYFKKENLRELLFIANAPYNLEYLFKEEFEKAGLKINEISRDAANLFKAEVDLNEMSKEIADLYTAQKESSDISFDKVVSDPKWKDYVFRSHLSYNLGGERSLGKINPPLMLEALINRVSRLKKECGELEANCDKSFLNSNADYLHKKWEYFAAKLQVLLLDIRRATGMKAYDSVSAAERNANFKIAHEESYWALQLGKYADGWLHNDYQLADEYIESQYDNRPTGRYDDSTHQEIKENYSKYGGWQSSDEAYCRKCEIAKEMKSINKLLSQIGECSPIYNEDLPFKCQDEFKIERRERGEHDFSVSLLRPKDILYNEGNDLAALEFNKSVGIASSTYKKGIIRFDRGYIAAQDATTKAASDDLAAQDNFASSKKGEEIKGELGDLLAKGISADAIKKILSELEEK